MQCGRFPKPGKVRVRARVGIRARTRARHPNPSSNKRVCVVFRSGPGSCPLTLTGGSQWCCGYGQINSTPPHRHSLAYYIGGPMWWWSYDTLSPLRAPPHPTPPHPTPLNTGGSQWWYGRSQINSMRAKCAKEAAPALGTDRSQTLTHSLTHSLNHLITNSPNPSTHLRTHSLTHSLTQLLTYLLTYSLTTIHPLTHLLFAPLLQTPLTPIHALNH